MIYLGVCLVFILIFLSFRGTPMNLSADDLLDAISNKKYSLKKVEPPTTLGKNENINSKNLIFDTIFLPFFDTD